MDRFDHLFVQPASFDASLAFYRDALGWKLQAEWGGDGEPRGAILGPGGAGAMSIVLAEPHPATDKSKTHGINGTRPTTHLRVDDIDARYARDPDGNLIAFEQPEQHGAAPTGV